MEKIEINIDECLREYYYFIASSEVAKIRSDLADSKKLEYVIWEDYK